MKYQLILQLPGSSVKDFDEMIEFEEELIETLRDVGYVDGHDAGSGEMNIFIHTDNPKAAFERVKGSRHGQSCITRLKAAFRQIGKDEYTILYPKGLSNFSIS